MEEEINNKPKKNENKILLAIILLIVIVVIALVLVVFTIKPKQENNVVNNSSNIANTNNSTGENVITNIDDTVLDNVHNNTENSDYDGYKSNSNVDLGNKNGSDDEKNPEGVQNFNSQFKNYENVQSGVTIKNFIAIIDNSNETEVKNNGSRIVDVKINGINGLKSMYVNDRTNLIYMRNKIDENKNYNISFKYSDETGYITNIDIDQIND